MAIQKQINAGKISKVQKAESTNVNKIYKIMENIGKQAIENFQEKKKETDIMNFNQEYIIKKGETLSEIAKKYNLTYQELAEYNNISDANYIEEGQIIKIPEIKEEPKSISKNEYIVKKGDTLSEIAKKYNLTYQELAKYNNISDPDYIEIDQVIKIPTTEEMTQKITDEFIANLIINGAQNINELINKFAKEITTKVSQEPAKAKEILNKISNKIKEEVGKGINIPIEEVKTMISKINNQINTNLSVLKEKEIQDQTNAFIASIVTSGAQNINELINKFAKEITTKVSQEPAKAKEILNKISNKIKEEVGKGINIPIEEVKTMISKINNQINTNLTALKEKEVQAQTNDFIAKLIINGAQNINELVDKFTKDVAKQINDVSNYQKIIKNIEEQLFNAFTNTTINVKDVVNQIQKNVIEQNIENYKIETHDHIDNKEGERDRRIAFLTDGYTIDNPPSESEIAQKMTTIKIPIWNGNEMTERNLIVNKKLTNQVSAIFKEIADKKFPIEFAQELDGGNGNYEVEGYEYRPTGSGRLSDHSYGGAIDINAVHNPQTGPRDALTENDGSQYVVNEQIIEIFAKYGFYWGGDWNSSCDPMHFSFTGY